MTPAAHGATSPWGGAGSVADPTGHTHADDGFVDGHQLLAQDDSTDPMPGRYDAESAGWGQEISAGSAATTWDDHAPADRVAKSETGTAPRGDDSTGRRRGPSHGATEWTAIDSAAGAGLSGRGLILVSGLAAGGCALLDLALTGGRMTFFFDLCFVVICLVATMAVRRDDLFTAGVLPPLLFAGVIAAVALAVPDAFDSAPGLMKVFLSGLAGHAAGLVGGYCLALLCVAARSATSEGSRA